MRVLGPFIRNLCDSMVKVSLKSLNMKSSIPHEDFCDEQDLHVLVVGCVVLKTEAWRMTTLILSFGRNISSQCPFLLKIFLRNCRSFKMILCCIDSPRPILSNWELCWVILIHPELPSTIRMWSGIYRATSRPSKHPSRHPSCSKHFLTIPSSQINFPDIFSDYIYRGVSVYQKPSSHTPYKP